MLTSLEGSSTQVLYAGFTCNICEKHIDYVLKVKSNRFNNIEDPLKDYPKH